MGFTIILTKRQGQLALDTNETPVGCVLVWRDQIIAKGMNATNITRNGTRHAEFMALSALLSRKEKDDIEAKNATDFDDSVWGDVDPTDGHVFPYGQKLHPAPVVDRAIVNECTLYVTVEPCVMCASLLRQLGVKKVYFGAVNDKFGGTGGVFRIHMNSKPVPMPEDRPYQNGYGPAPIEKAPKSQKGWIPREDDEGDGGNVEPGFPAEGGYLRDEAVSLLRRFYVQENGRGKSRCFWAVLGYMANMHQRPNHARRKVERPDFSQWRQRHKHSRAAHQKRQTLQQHHRPQSRRNLRCCRRPQPSPRRSQRNEDVVVYHCKETNCRATRSASTLVSFRGGVWADYSRINSVR